MKNCFLMLSTLAFIYSCNQEPLITVGGGLTSELETRGEKKDVMMCSFDGNKGIFKVIVVKEKNLAKHLANGDYILDADGDGYSALGACMGTMDDCDDNQSSINPGVAEICDNEIDEDCDGLIECNDPDCSETCNTCPCFELEDLTARTPYSYVCDAGSSLVIDGNGFRLVVTLGHEVYFLDSVNLVFCNQQINSTQYVDCRNIALQAIEFSGRPNDCAIQAKTTNLPTARKNDLQKIIGKETHR